ncbi:XdhC family protein [Chelativorans intermedius]|uniref:XdhC family protein n=1 Tax=Chelativorans intermedius TaxID=515947 RepID=A0ABV6D3B2_9HYPH|nr:XdhC family protein [Chelativorans intermedius]MCT8998399.1 XdhC family protein [Chelativorans intermedius]
MDAASLKTLNRCRRERRAAVLLTDLESGASRVLVEGEAPEQPLREPVEKALRSGRSGTVEAGGRSYFLNVHLPPPRLVVIGAVHISQALAPMARIAGFDVRIVDPRTAFASPERFAGVRLQAVWPQEAFEESPLDAYTALAALTHDPKIDDPALTAALEAGCFYVGALGSRKTHAKRVERLTHSGLGAAAVARIHAPIGLAIGAASPAEIAVAILAQVIAALRSRGLEERGEAA